MRRGTGLLVLRLAPHASPRVAAPILVSAYASSIRPVRRFLGSARFLHAEQADALESPSPPLETFPGAKPKANRTYALVKRIKNSDSTYHEALEAFNDMRARGLKLKESQYLSLLYKAAREGRLERVWEGYEEFLEDEKHGNVMTKQKSPTTWPKLTHARLQMHRFVLWAMLDAQREKAMGQFYQSEVVGKYNKQGIHEADPFNFLLRMECTTKGMDEQDHGLRLRVETLLNTMERQKWRTSYSSTHALFRLLFHRPEIFIDYLVDAEDAETTTDAQYVAEEMGKVVIGYMERFPYAFALDPKRLSIAVSTAAGAGYSDAAKLLLQYGSTNHVPIDAGSFAHAVESAPDEDSRLKVADLYMHAKEHELIYTTQDTDTSISNYLLLHAVFDGNFKHTMELLHEMELYNNMAGNRTVHELFKSIAQYRADIRRGDDQSDADRKLAECPTIMELFDRFPNVIPRSVHSFSLGIRHSLYAGDLAVALDLMRAANWSKDVKLRPEIYSQLLYPLLAGGQRGGDESIDASMFDRLEVERCFDRQYPKQRTHLNSLIVNICQSNEDFSTMLVCLDRWQGQGHPPMSRRVIKRVFDVISKQIQQLQNESDEVAPGTVFIVEGMDLSYFAFMVRYHNIVTWDAWTIQHAIVRARTNGLYATVVALLTEADSRGLVLNSAAYIVSLSVLEELGDPSAVVACVEKMKANDVWENAVNKDPEVQEILGRALAKLEELQDREL